MTLLQIMLPGADFHLRQQMIDYIRKKQRDCAVSQSRLLARCRCLSVTILHIPVFNSLECFLRSLLLLEDRDHLIVKV